MDARATARAAVAMLATAALLVVLVWVDPVRPENLTPLDTWWHDLAAPSGTITRRIALVLDDVGAGRWAFAIRVAIAVWLAVRRRWMDLAAWVAAWALTTLVVEALKVQTGRMRPNGLDLRSFPSGHAANAAQIAVGLVLFARPGRRSRWAWGAAIAWIVVMAWSRTALDLHHLSDVVAGALLGGGLMCAAFALTHRGADQEPAPPALASS
jgi:undecaprenyl-diphosphatase